MDTTEIIRSYLTDRYTEPSLEGVPVETTHRHINGAIPAPETREVL